jgi:capsular polysaccharide transport system permease protein
VIRSHGLTALLVQFRVIATLTLRETRATFGSSHLGYLWAIVQPLASISLLVLLFYLIGRQAPFGESLALFFATAILTLELYNKLSVSLMRAFTSNKALLTYPMITQTDTLFSRLALISLTFIIINLVYYSALIALGLASLPAHPELIILAFAGTCAFGFGVGTINAILYQRNPSWQYVEKIFSRPLFFLSGVFYIPSRLPPEAIEILKWNPILHFVELTRTGYYSNYESDVLSFSYPFWLTVFLISFGFFLERITRKLRQ